MAGFIIFEDGHAWAPAKWVYTNLLKTATKFMDNKHKSQLIDYIQNQEKIATFTIDFNKLNEGEKKTLKESILRAVDEINSNSGKEWAKPEFFEAFKNYSNAIKDMIIEIEENGEVNYKTKPKSVFKIENER